MELEKIKLNLGCGGDTPYGWLNVDCSPNVLLAKIPGNKLIKDILYKFNFIAKEAYLANWSSSVYFCDLNNDFPKIQLNTCSVIYSSHFLEHIPHSKAVKLIDKCYMVLAGGGILRLAVPDLYREAKEYVEKIEKALTEGNEETEASENFIRHMVSRSKRHSHLWMYDVFSLSKLLRDIGFVNIVRKEFLESDISNIELLEKREDSLFLECRKP